MAITKTKFINFVRCPCYSMLDKIKQEELEADISLIDYLQEEQEDQIKDILKQVSDEENQDAIDINSKQLDIMLPYYKKIEVLAGDMVAQKFKGIPKYSKATLNQESFDAYIDGLRYLCYVDIYNERKDGLDIIEVKATTVSNFLELGKKSKKNDNQLISIFKQDQDGIYRLKEEDPTFKFDLIFTEKDYHNHKQKLFDQYGKAGRYVYDLAVQRFIIEQDFITHGQKDKINTIKYYLAVLNGNYVFAGHYKDNEPIYTPDEKGNDIIVFIDLTTVTKDYQAKIKLDQKKIDTYLKEMAIKKCQVGKYCEIKKPFQCKYIPICWHSVPKLNSVLTYIDIRYGFKNKQGLSYDKYALINEGYLSILDIPEEWISKSKQIIQRQVVASNTPYYNLKKIAKGLKEITYPIYHLDFESFNCPLPRYKGESPYTQSVFQFSLYIERKPGICDIDKDHYFFLAKDHQDHRETLINKLLEYIDVNNKGTVLVYNQTFEKTRLKELGICFPKYQGQLTKMATMLFDLYDLIMTRTSFYQQLGFSTEEAQLFNFYHPSLNGSFSLKKVLPAFTDLNYDNLLIDNGILASITYANFNKMSPLEYTKEYNALLEYCKQDTWAMVQILASLRKIVKKSV